MKLYVGNLSFKAQESELSSLFSAHGEVASVTIIKDRYTGRSKGFAFVEMANEDGGRSAITALHDQDFQTRKLIVNEARPREERPERPERGNYGGGGGDRENKW